MNPFVLTLCFFMLTGWGSAQEVGRIDFDQVKETVADSTSNLYYPKLVRRFLDWDTTLTNAEFRHLYYGNVFQPYYHPYGATNAQKAFFDAYQKGEAFEKIEALGVDVLTENPVNLEVLLDMIFLYNHEKKIEQATVFANLYVSFLEVIYASGTGKDCNSGFVVISVDDEYRITGDLGLKVVKQDLIGECDRLSFSKKGQKRKNRIKGLYFNVRIPLTYLSKSYDKSDLPEADSAPDEEEND